MSWLVLAPEWDEAAGWAAEQLSAAGLAPLHYVTSSDLIGATWSHRLQDDVTVTTISLTDGRVIDGAEVRGTLNRLIQAPQEIVAALSIADRSYALQEFSALFLSWLHSLNGPMLNPPTPRGLCGAWRSPAEWALLLSECGLPAAPVLVNPSTQITLATPGFLSWPPYAPITEDVIVVGDAVFGTSSLDAKAIDGCRQLAAVSQTPLLGLAFDCATCSAMPEVVSVTPLPDLRAGGADLIEAIAQMLRSEASH